MKISAFRFYIREATRNVFHNGWMGVAAVFTIFCCLVMFGICMSLTLNANYLIKEVEANYDIPVSVDPAFTTEQLQALGDQILAIDGVREIEIVTKEEGLEMVKETLKDYEGLTEGLDEDNPLRHTIRVNLTDLTQGGAIVDKIKGLEGVLEIKTRYETRQILMNITNAINKGSMWLMLILGLISVFIIANTIRIAVFARRKEINIMKFVGATDWFIRWPFLIEGIIIGLIGCFFAFILLWIGYDVVAAKLSDQNIATFGYTILPFKDVWVQILVSFIGLSAILGGIGSFMAIRKHLKV